jgi:putative peptide zinc metalloprotease protein
MTPDTPPVVTDATRVRLHQLSMRPDGSEWIVGRIATGEFIAVEEVAVEVMRLLDEGLPVGEVRRRLAAETGRDLDVAGGVADLVELGFVAAVDGRPIAGPPVPTPTLPWLRPRHVRWMVTRPVGVGLVVLVAAAVLVLIRRPDMVPTARDLLWSPHGWVVLAGNAAICWSIIAVHELAHLATARAAGLPGRISLSTRLQFLAAQTTVSGIHGHPARPTRVTVYLSGMAVNVAVAAAAVLVGAAAAPGSMVARMSAATALVSLLCLMPQFLVFMRTDIYFLLQDLTSCRNLYASGSAYVRWWGRILWWRVAGRADRAADPSDGLPPRERRAVRVYAGLLLAGTAGAVGVAVTVTLPVAVTILTAAMYRLFTAGSPMTRLDGALTFGVIGGYWVLWCRTWWRRHGPRVSAACRWLRKTGSVGLTEDPAR